MPDIKQQIKELLPYKTPFLFVDEILSVNENEIKGKYQFKKDEFFYKGHFPDYPVTPGVIITEMMAQIGLVSLGFYLLLLDNKKMENVVPVFTSSNVEYLDVVLPEETLVVSSKKKFFRSGKLKCYVNCFNEVTGKEVCRGELSGIIIDKNGR